jgi:hypothetical protein
MFSPRMTTPNANYNNFGGIGHGFIDASDLNRSLRYLPATRYPRALVSGPPRPMSPTLHRFTNRAIPTMQNTCLENGYGSITATDDDTVDGNEDFEMASVGPRRPSELDDGAPLPAGQPSMEPGYICSCTRENQETPSDPRPNYILIRDSARFPRLPSVTDLLNPGLALAETPGQGQSQNASYPSRPNAPPTNPDGIYQPSQLAAPLISQASSLLSTTSSTLLLPRFSIPEQRYFLLNTLHHTCLAASSTYGHSLLPNPGRRRIQHEAPRHGDREGRYHPYSPPPGSRTSRARAERGGRRARDATLMDNISAICTHLWRKARDDGMAPHREEAEAVKSMRDLYKWGEIVVRGMEGIENEESEEGSVLSGVGMRNENRSDGVMVGEAAKRLCGWFRDAQAWSVCEGVVGELRALVERERENVVGAGSNLSLDSEDGLGGIL